MQIFNADNLSFIMLGFAKTIEISFFAIIFSIVFGTVLAMVKQYCTGKLRPLSLLVSAYTCCGFSLSTLRSKATTS